MNPVQEDLDDSALLCMSVFQKRKAAGDHSSKNSKQLKLSFAGSPSKQNKMLEFQDDRLSKSQDSSEYKSSYFSKKKNSNVCPLCLKTFESDSGYATHMKQCAKKRKMTTQQLLVALELQKKHLGERRALGLSSQITPSLKKSKKSNGDKLLEADCDLALGLALSKSLENSGANTGNKVNGTEAPVSVLEEFGFTFSGTTAGPSKKRSKALKKSVLRERTKEERQRILTEKAAVVLLDEDGEKESEKIYERSFLLKNILLKKYQKQTPYLWNLGENEGKPDWYVEGLQNLLQIEEREEEIEIEKEKVEEEEKEEDASSSAPDIQAAILELNLPRGDIHQDWKKMINNESYSDLKGRTKDCQNFYLHSLIVFARSADILEKNLESIFQEFNLSTILIFLEYLYCGTLNGLTVSEMEYLFNLANTLNYEELINVLNGLKVSLSEAINKPCSDPIPEKEEDCIMEEVRLEEEEKSRDLTVVQGNLPVEDMVDLTQSSREDDIVGESPGSNEDKSFWSFLMHEKEREKMEEERREEEEKENLEISTEMEKIETSMKQQEERMKRMLNEFEKEEEGVEFDRIYPVESDSETKDLEEFQSKMEKQDDVIVLSSDTETRASKTEDDGVSEQKAVYDFDYDIPSYDPYDNFNRISPVGEGVRSPSLISGDASFGLETVEEEAEGNSSPGCCSTPKPNRMSSRIKSLGQRSSIKKKKRRDLSASRIIRKSLGLKAKNSKSGSGKKRTPNREKTKILKLNEGIAETLTDSIMKDLCNSPLFTSSTPVRSADFVELTDSPHGSIILGETVTPSPNFSVMGESYIKEQLSKYGLKKSLAKSKAKKILLHIYEELHPILNTETGKLVKILPTEKAKGGKKKTKATTVRKRTNAAKPKQKEKSPNKNSSKESGGMSNETFSSLDKSTECDSDGSEFEDLNEPFTQTASTSALDLPSAFREFLSLNPKFHQKILLYEPIWLEEVQKSLKETFKKRFKLSDIMNYLDRQCITFRSAAQKRNNEKKAQAKMSQRKKKSSNS